MKNPICLLLFFTFTPMLLLSQGDTLFTTLEHDGLDRNYILYVPSAYDGSAALPLVINLHGYSNTAELHMNHTHMIPVAEAENFLLVYPEGTMVESTVPNIPPRGLGWNITYPERDDRFLSVNGPNDVDFISTLIDEISENYQTDARRIYATGWSNGGVMSQTLACQLSGRIAAIAPVGGTAYSGTPCHPVRPVPILHMHGTGDPIVDYFNGDASGTLLPVADHLTHWRSVNGCTDNLQLRTLPDLVPDDGSTVEVEESLGCTADVIAIRLLKSTIYNYLEIKKGISS